MTRKRTLFSLSLLFALGCGGSEDPATTPPTFDVMDVGANYDPASDTVIFQITTLGAVATTAPEAAGSVDGAPVWGYVFTTTLSPANVGFGEVEGTLALAVTSHPDFDDTPLWNEDGAGGYEDDGATYHAHWVVLGADERAPAGLAVLQAPDAAMLPPSAPMPMYLDSPGFTVIEDGVNLRVIVPMDRIRRPDAFEVTGLAAKMTVHVVEGSPLLVVDEVLSTTEGERSAQLAGAPAESWPLAASVDSVDGTEPSLEVSAASVTYEAALGGFLFTMDVGGEAGGLSPVAAGGVDGAPVLGYVFPTTIPPSALGFVEADGILALAVTSHPDFDDTPYWDESRDGDYANDGAVYHAHWAVLSSDTDSPGGFSVLGEANASVLPPTAPMELDSPGYHTFAQGGRLTVVVPGWHLRGVDGFRFDALSAAMRVDTSGSGPVLRVEAAFNVLSGDLSLPFDAELAQ